MPPVLLVEQRDSPRAMLRSTLEREGYAVEEAADGARAAQALSRGRYLVVIADLGPGGAEARRVLEASRESGLNPPIILLVDGGALEDAAEAVRAGAFDYMSRPVDPGRLLLLIRRAVERRALAEENLLLKQELADRLGFPRIIGQSAALSDVALQIRKIAPTDAAALLQGEPGTGKELFARAIHHLSARCHEPFVAVRCAGMPEVALEIEMFGRAKRDGEGVARAGGLELAHRGTLFLDEVGEIGPSVQARLVRFLQESRPIGASLRIVAATTCDLRRAVARGRFREDLCFLLTEAILVVPPLRQRGEDILLLARHFLERYGRELRRGGLAFGDSACEAMRRHHWPGNVRELANAVERAALLAEDERIEPWHLGLGGPMDRDEEPDEFERGFGLEGSLDEVGARARDQAQRHLIRRALQESHGNRARAAQALQVNYKRLLVRIKELGLDSEPAA